MSLWEIVIAPVFLRKTTKINGLRESENTDGSSALSRGQLTYSMFSGLTEGLGQTVSNTAFPTHILWFWTFNSDMYACYIALLPDAEIIILKT